MASYYEILGVNPTADQSTVRKAYLKLSLKHHPDKNPGAEEEAKANFIRIGQAYEVLGDPIKRAQYDREIQGGTFAFKRRHNQTNNDDNDVQNEQDFNSFMNMFDETVARMSEEELNMAMGAAAVVGGLIGSVMASRAAKGNSLLSSAAQMMGSAVASRAASSLVQSVHTDSRQRVLEREEREAAIARGESVREPSATDTRDRLFKDAKNTVQKVAEAAFGGGASSSTNSATYTNMNYSNNNGRGSGMTWGQAAKLAAMAAGAVAEMQRNQPNARRR